MFPALIFEIITMCFYRDWQVTLTVCLVGLLPLILNAVWILLPYNLKRRTVISNKLSFVFYTIQAILLLFCISTVLYFFASFVAWDGWKDDYLWTVIWIMESTFLTLTGVFASLEVVSFTLLVFHYRRHLQRSNKPIDEMI